MQPLLPAVLLQMLHWMPGNCGACRREQGSALREQDLLWGMAAEISHWRFQLPIPSRMIAQYPCQAIDDADGGRLIDNGALAADAYDMADAMLAARERA